MTVIKKIWGVTETIAVIDGDGSGGYTWAGKNGVREKQADSVETISTTSFFLSSRGLVKQIWVGLA
jgi:hypothetical protein